MTTRNAVMSESLSKAMLRRCIFFQVEKRSLAGGDADGGGSVLGAGADEFARSSSITSAPRPRSNLRRACSKASVSS